MGLIIKDNDATINIFLNKIDALEYDKKAIRLRVDILNETPSVVKFLSATESGYYKDHPDYNDVADRKKVGTFRADCIHGMYLIHASRAHNLSFEDGSVWDFIAFSNTSTKSTCDDCRSV